jgi:hypothetical protein
MKREKKEVYSQLWSHFPLFFWKQCVACNREFRREWGWRFHSGPYHGGAATTRYICSGCASDEQEATGIIQEKPWIPERPSASPSRQ